MKVGFVKAEYLVGYLRGEARASLFEGDYFAGTLVAITYDSDKRAYCVISR